MKYITLIMFMLYLVHEGEAQKRPYPKLDSPEILSVIDTLHGHAITDPYRGLEDLSDTKIQKWFEAQQKYTEQELSKLSQRPVLYKESKKLNSLRKSDVSFIFPTRRMFFIKKLIQKVKRKKLSFVMLKGKKRHCSPQLHSLTL